MEPDLATLAATPSGMAPEGMVSNFVDPVSRAWNVQVTIGITLLPAILLVVLRIYARLGLARSLWVDDYVCILAAASTIVFNGLVLSFLDKPGGGPLGRHIWDVSLLRLQKYKRPSTVESVFLRLSNTLIKVSLLTFYLRLFNPDPRLKVMIWIGLVAVTVFLIGILIGTLVLCHDATWLGVPPQCYALLPNLTTAGTVFSVISDFYILFIPIHLVPSLKLSRRRKIAVASIFLIGFGACLAGVANLVIRFAAYLPTNMSDFTWDVIDTYITKVAETNIGLMCACLPVVSPVVLGPMRRLHALFSPYFRGPEVNIPGTRGYRDLPVTAHVDSRTRVSPGVQIPRATITGLHSLIQKISNPGYTHDEFAEMTTLAAHTNSRSSHSLVRSAYMRDENFSSRETISVV
ncbi:hypothetical protein F4777DRAFT_579648 [Nemania sp. FL0916]|nr:hypothetical protein F4777DRAFT_579648 [Nemania sp. FL0916]